MVSSSSTNLQDLATDTWVKAGWEEFLRLADDSVEIGASSLSDDLGWKRLLYERAGIQEYWVNDANARRAIAFTIAERRSGEI